MQLISTGTPIPALLVRGLCACAGTPPSRPAPAVTPEPIANAAPTTEPTPRVAGTTDNRDDENPFPGTITRKGPNGQTLYCRKDEVAGTRIPQLVCATEAVMRSREEEARRMVDEARTTSSLGGCNPSAGC